MKVCVNAIPNLSVPDGWWLEGYARNPNAGWNIGSETIIGDQSGDAGLLREALEWDVMPKFFEDRDAWVEMMKQAMTLGAHFSSDRMMQEYAERAFGL